MDPSNSFESQAFVNANQQTEAITCMSCDSYNAAAKGNIDFFKANTDQSLDLTPNKNTILHIYITALNAGSESTTNFVKEILEINERCHSLLGQANAKGETPLHIAARYGHSDIVEVLFKYCPQTLHDQDLEDGVEPVKEMLRMTNKEKDTALHEAVRYNHLEVVKLLISKDPDFSYSANDAGETPLYIAAERGFRHVLFEILDNCESPRYEGPLGRTALHAAVMYSDEGMVKKILEKIDGISRKVDNDGLTPLHLTAYFNFYDIVAFVKCQEIAMQLLNKDRKVAYMKDTKGRTPLHIAALRGCDSITRVIVERCPDCCELVDNEGWNVLHFAIKGGNQYMFLEEIINIIIENTSLSNLLNEKNANGDTPLHFYSTSSKSLELRKFVSHPRLDKMAFTKQHLNAKEITSAVKRSFKERKKFFDAMGSKLPQRVIDYEGGITIWRSWYDSFMEECNEERRSMLSMLQKATEVHLVVAALIATVTFAACITMPGGFVGGGEGSHPGSALLRRNAAFKAFVIMDTISMVLSSSAVFIHLLMPFLFDKDINAEKRRMKLVVLAFILILGAMVAMGLAFVTGTYAVLVPSFDLAIANCIVGLTFFAIFFPVFKKFLGSSLFQLCSFFQLEDVKDISPLS